jgi:gluconolactonase
MWNMKFTPPVVIEARALTRLPDRFRAARENAWASANKPGHRIECFLEGPAFDRAGNLYVTDIPYGRIFRISPQLDWELVAEYDGWPNGIAIHADGTLWIADYRRGILRLDAASGALDTPLGHRNSEGFKGPNDLTFDRAGNLYFTDQGQTGLHDPTGRVYRLAPSGKLDRLLDNVPSPNGIALDRDEAFLYTAVTRGNSVWRGPLLADGSLSKVGAFRTFFGTSGPDGLAVDADNRLVVAHASLGGAFVVEANGDVTYFVRSPMGGTVTNVAFRPGTSRLVMTESGSGTVLEADLPAPGVGLYSHLG